MTATKEGGTVALGIPSQETARGSLARQSPASVLQALGLISQGRVYSLESGWWRGMPGHPMHPRFEVLSYRTPAGFRLQQDNESLNLAHNEVGYGYASELIMGSAHTGTHLDALCHVWSGAEQQRGFDGLPVSQGIGDFGGVEHDASTLPPIIAPGVLLDVPALTGRDHLGPGEPVNAQTLIHCCERQGLEVKSGDAVLIRTGHMRAWPDTKTMAASLDSGITLDAAQWLAKREVTLVGSDNASVECTPSGIPGDPKPCHLHLIRENGIPLLEWVYLEELAAERRHEFAFFALPLTIRGATGSMVRPVAIV